MISSLWLNQSSTISQHCLISSISVCFLPCSSQFLASLAQSHLLHGYLYLWWRICGDPSVRHTLPQAVHCSPMLCPSDSSHFSCPELWCPQLSGSTMIFLYYSYLHCTQGSVPMQTGRENMGFISWLSHFYYITILLCLLSDVWKLLAYIFSPVL